MITEGKYYKYIGEDFTNEVVLCADGERGRCTCLVVRPNGDIWTVFKDQLEELPENKTNPEMLLPTDAQERKEIPIVTGVLDYFPLAIAEVAKCSKAGNDQHHPGEPLFWDRDKSTDHADCIGRHLIDRGKFDTDGHRHSAKLAWRGLALLQLELEAEKKGNV